MLLVHNFGGVSNSQLHNFIFIRLNIIGIFSSLLVKINVIQGLDYLIEFLFIFYTISIILRRGVLYVPKKYLCLIFFFLCTITLNVFSSRYATNIGLSIFGTYITFLPFLYFIFSYNYSFSENEIVNYVDIIIKSILTITSFFYFEGIILHNHTSGRIIDSSIFAYGFVASICNQALILCLFLYNRLHKRKFIYLSVYFISTIIIISQIKAVIGMLIILLIYTLYMNKNIISGFIKSFIVISILIMAVFSIPYFNDKFNQYMVYYNVNDKSSEGTARVAMYDTAVKIAHNHFPIGTGQASFGSVPTNINYSKVYTEYNIDHIWGLRKDKHDYILDTHWAYILGENGWLGTILYVFLMFYTILFQNKTISRLGNNYKFLILMTTLCMSIESFALPLPNRIAFISIYSGLSAIILRYATKVNL